MRFQPLEVGHHGGPAGSGGRPGGGPPGSGGRVAAAPAGTGGLDEAGEIADAIESYGSPARICCCSPRNHAHGALSSDHGVIQGRAPERN